VTTVDPEAAFVRPLTSVEVLRIPVVERMRDPPLDVIEVRGKVTAILVCAVPSLVRVVEAKDSDHRANVFRWGPIWIRQGRAEGAELFVAIPNDFAGPTADRAWQPARGWHLVRIQLPSKGRKRVSGHEALCRTSKEQEGFG
jgi:hypothetical protein